MIRSSLSRFSALQRAENSSMVRGRVIGSPVWRGFSALQRAENSSIRRRPRRRPRPFRFSALQRAENSSIARQNETPTAGQCFSALQRAENSSIRHYRGGAAVDAVGVSVLFSEPKIPQLPHPLPGAPGA